MRAYRLLVILAAVFAAVAPAVPEYGVAAPQVRIRIATETPGHADVILGNAVAAVINRVVPGVEAVAEPGLGAIGNLRLLGEKRTDVAFAGSAVVWEAFWGREQFQGRPVPVRTLTPIYNNVLQLVAVEASGITTLDEVRGKRVSIGRLGTASGVQSRVVLSAAGIDINRDIRKEELLNPEAVEALKARRIDAAFLVGAAYPAAEVVELANTPGLRIRVIPLDGTLPAIHRERGSQLFRIVIRKEIYGLPADVGTVAAARLLVVREEFSADIAYAITKAIYENRAELARAHPFAQQITLIGLAARSPVPYHPGSVRYYRERGVEGF